MTDRYHVRVLFDHNGAISEPGSYRRRMTTDDPFDVLAAARRFAGRYTGWVPTRKVEILDAETMGHVETVYRK